MSALSTSQLYNKEFIYFVQVKNWRSSLFFFYQQKKRKKKKNVLSLFLIFNFFFKLWNGVKYIFFWEVHCVNCFERNDLDPKLIMHWIFLINYVITFYQLRHHKPGSHQICKANNKNNKRITSQYVDKMDNQWKNISK